MRKMEDYHCDTLTIVAVARYAFLPELNPFNYEIGIFSINFDYDHSRLVPVEKINDSNLRTWEDFNYLFELQPDNDYDEILKKNFGLSYIKNKVEKSDLYISRLEEHLEAGSPVIACCNSYHLPYTEYYQKKPGGNFQAYHHIVVYGINRQENHVWIYDPTLTNYAGNISLDHFIQALEDERGINAYEGLIYFCLEYDGKEFNDINRELLLWALDYYLDKKTKQIKEKLLLFFNDFIYYYKNFNSIEFQNKLLEFGFFFLRTLGLRRQHWGDFLQYYKNLEDINHIQEDLDAFKANNDKLLSIPNTLYAYTLKNKNNLKFENLADKLVSICDEEERIFRSLYEKIK
ncbi:MAG: BtrH N-terminal domain-containing protein [Acidobacteria bacterium]|nr:BtrH N-terminal domain-containing protein [Acidobacteriota bacterium]